MEHLSSILNSSLGRPIALIVLLCAPLAFFEWYFVPEFSGRNVEMDIIRHEKEREGEKKSLLLGDSTARRFHFWYAIEPKRRVNRAEDQWLNMGLGGSSIVEWLTLAKKNMASETSLEAIAIVAVGSNYNNGTNIFSSPYAAYLFDRSDIIRYLAQRELSFSEAARTYLRTIFHTYSDRHEVLMKLFSFIPPLAPWSNQIIFRGGGIPILSAPTSTGLPRDFSPSALEEKHEGRFYQELVDEAAAKKKRLLFVFSPVHSRERLNGPQKSGYEIYKKVCAQTKASCLDLGDHYPDEAFESDFTHLKPEFLPDFFSKVESALQKTEI